MRPSVSIIITCKGRLAHLKQALPTILAQNYYGSLEVIVVDYACPDGTAAYLKEVPAVRCVEATNCGDFFNMSRSRNIGACHSNADILAFVDSHNLISPSYISEVVRQLTLADLTFPGDICGSLATPRNMYHRLRGFDEALKGYGCEDGDFYIRAQLAGYVCTRFSKDLISIIPHTIEDKVRFYPNKNLEENIELNRQACADKHRPINPSGYGK